MCLYRKLGLWSFFLIGCVLTACGGGSSKTTEINTTPVQGNSGTTTKLLSHSVELGPVVGATIQIYAPSSNILLYSTMTDNDGQYLLDVTKLTDALKQLTVKPMFLLVQATEGMDVDPNDDGIRQVNEAVPVKGVVKGIVPTDEFLNNKGVRINLISSAIADLLEGSADITEERISQLALDLGVKDINADGKITSADVYRYEMFTHDSRAKRVLQFSYLSSLHSGDTEKRRQYVEILKDDLNAIRVSIRYADGKAYLKLFGLKSTDIVRYSTNGILVKDGNIYSGGEIALAKDQIVTYQECLTASNTSCFTEQVAYFNGNEVQQYLPLPVGFGNIYKNPEKINQAYQVISQSKKRIEQEQENLRRSDVELREITNNISKLNAEISELQKKLN